MDKGREDSEVGSLYPVSEHTTRRALFRVIGNKVTDFTLWGRYQHHVSVNQPALWNGLIFMGDFRAMTGRLAEAEVIIQEHAYLGGALIYLAAVQEQARDQGKALKQISEDEFNAWKRDDMRSALTQEDIATVEVAAWNETRNEDLVKLSHASLANSREVRDKIVDRYTPSVDNSPLFEQATQELAAMATKTLMAACVKTIKFLGEEPHFTTVMRDWWWDSVHPDISFSQKMGARDMHDVLYTAGIK